MPTRRWVLLGWAGYAVILLAMLTAFLAMFAKEQFSWLVGSMFLQWMVGTFFVGAVAMLVAVFKLPYRKTKRAAGVAAWALVALTSPFFGLMFLLPWTVLILTAPLVFAALYSWRQPAETAAVH